ncbi:MAG: hypothetical protein M3Q97_08260 [Bacteroidota bacterium]|nr:hypothetical protein [Bacteroidota bacterium]
MKKASDELHRLIHSMSKTEKRYFQIFASRHVQGEQNSYLSLYDAVASQKSYDEESIKQQFSGEKVADYLPAAKYYLIHLILDSLHAFAENSNIDAKLRKELHYAEILFNKGLIDLSSKMLGRVKTKAYKFEKFPILIEILSLEKSILSRTYFKDIDEKDLKKLYEEEQDIVLKESNINDYWYLHGRAYHYHFRKGVIRDESVLAVFDEIAAHSLMQNDEIPLSFRAQMDYWQIKAINSFTRGQLQEAYNFNERFLTLMEDNPEKITEFPRRYIASLNNFLIDSLNLRKYELMEYGLQKLKALPEKEVFRQIPKAEADIFRLATILELNAAINRGQFDNAFASVPEIEAGLQNFTDRIVKHNIITIYYLVAYVCFGAGKYKESLRWCNKIINDTGDEMVESIYSFARILNLVIHYELKNYDLLEYARKSTFRYLKAKKSLFELEKSFINFLKKQENIHSPEAMKQSFRDLRTELMPIKDKKGEGSAFEYFDFIAWLDSKIEDISFKDAVKRKLI